MKLGRLVVFEDITDTYPHELHYVADLEEATALIWRILANTASDDYADHVKALWEASETKDIITSLGPVNERYVFVPSAFSEKTLVTE